MKLLGMEFIGKVMKTALWSSALAKPTKRVSLLFIAPFGEGKSSVVLQHRYKIARELSDCTATGIYNLAFKAFERRKFFEYLLLPDITVIQGKTTAAAKNLVNALNGLMEEGLATWVDPKREIDFQEVTRDGERLRLGVITCITNGMMQDRRQLWSVRGFLSRFLPVNFNQSKALRSQILDFLIASDDELWEFSKDVEIKTGTQGVSVNLPEKYRPALKRLVENRYELENAYVDAVNARKSKGIRPMLSGLSDKRLTLHYKAMLRANALRHGRNTVRSRDMEFIEELDQFVSFVQAKEIGR